ncbi:MAG: bifunctional 4-hydroxy-3-methylbut-2-enyl diphosphate reductase/30S ribosomal protein S1 [Chloroflexota bacterium]
MGRLEIRVASAAGFCAGVRRAVETALRAAVEQGEAYTLGPLIHNRRVSDWLSEHGVRSATNLADIPKTVVFPSHGIGPEVVAEAERRGLTVYDATCPLVRLAQTRAAELADQGYRVIVVGDATHTEVKGIVAWTGGRATVVSGPAEAAALGPLDRVGVVAQTTERPALVAATVEELRRHCREVRYEPTSCHVVTEERQEQARELAGWAELMLVVGGHDSANTGQLAKVCREAGTPTEHIEGAAELRPEWFRGKSRIGVTAGGSTPEWIMEEVIRAVKEFDEREAGSVNQEAAGQADQLPNLHQGDIIKGRVASVSEDAVMVDIGYKTEGVIPKEELGRGEIVSPGFDLKVGDEVEVEVVEISGPDGNPVLSKKKADDSQLWADLEASLNEGAIIETTAAQAVKGGLLVDLHGVRGFVPASQVALSRVDDLTTWVGKPMRLRVIEIDKERNRAVLSQRKVLEAEQASKREETWAKITEGAVLDGTVRRLTDFGAFVDIGGIDGLVHVSEMGWERVSHPSEVVKEGDQIKVKVLKVDREAGRISLSLRATMPDPWRSKIEKYREGQVVTGKVVRLADFGAFVQLEEGLDGLVHISQLADHRVNRPDEVVSVGQEVKVKIIGIKPNEKRISLSIREVSEDADRDQYKSYMQSQRSEGRVTIADILEEKKKDEEGR